MSRTVHRTATVAVLLSTAACGTTSPSRGPATGPLGVEPLRAPSRTPGPRYALPSCPLDYEVAVVESDQMEAPGLPGKLAASRLEAFSALAARAR